MDDSFFVLLVILFIVAPLLEKLFKGAGRGSQQQPPQQRRRQVPLERRRLPDGRTMTVGQSEPGAAEETEGPRDASDLLPADLWEILTGQRQQPAPSSPAPPEPAPVEVREPEAGPERRPEPARPSARWPASRRPEPAQDEEAEARALMRRRERATTKARTYDHSPPPIVSLETEPASETVRHRAFHERLDHLPKAPSSRVVAFPELDLDMDDVDSLRRAIILQEVLGRPKGLD